MNSDQSLYIYRPDGLLHLAKTTDCFSSKYHWLITYITQLEDKCAKSDCSVIMQRATVADVTPGPATTYHKVPKKVEVDEFLNPEVCQGYLLNMYLEPNFSKIC